MDPGIRELLRLVSMLVSVPVALYAGWPFYAGAWQALRARSISMDVPVSIGIVLAFVASVWNALRGHGEVYFDSVTMFVFFLALGRYVEMIARHRAGSVADALARLAPVTARRAARRRGRGRAGDANSQPATSCWCAPARSSPRTASVTEGTGRVDESMLTGESTAIAKDAGSRCTPARRISGRRSRVRVAAVADKTVLAGIVALLERAQAERPRLARAADRAAAWFLGRILIGAAVVFVVWWFVDPSRAFSGDARRAGRDLSLRAVARDARRDRRRHLGARAPRRAGGALRCTRDAGQGEPRAVGQDGHADEGPDPRRGSARARGRAGVRMPVARARARAHVRAPDRARVPGVGYGDAQRRDGRRGRARARVSRVRVGERRLRIGHPAFAAGLAPSHGSAGRGFDGESWVCLGDARGLLAAFRLTDQLRPEAGECVAAPARASDSTRRS